MDKKGSSEYLDVAGGSRTPDGTSESFSLSERSVTGNDSSSKGSASPSKSLCSSTSTSAENVSGMEMKVNVVLGCCHHGRKIPEKNCKPKVNHIPRTYT